MANWKYVDQIGNTQEATPDELRQLAECGAIKPDTVVVSPNGKTAAASKVSGLDFANIGISAETKASWMANRDNLLRFHASLSFYLGLAFSILFVCPIFLSVVFAVLNPEHVAFKVLVVAYAIGLLYFIYATYAFIERLSLAFKDYASIMAAIERR